MKIRHAGSRQESMEKKVTARAGEGRTVLPLFMAFFILMAGMVLAAPGGCSAAASDDFVITVQTNNSGTSGSTQFTIPTFPGETYNYNVDCNNDGTNEATGITGNYTCNYAAAGPYTIRIKDNTGSKTGFPRIYFNNGGDRLKLLTIGQWGTGKWTSMEYSFWGCANLAGQASDAPDLSGVTNMSRMFDSARAFNQNIGSWNTSKVEYMELMFSEASSFNQDIGSWNTASVKSMYGMFQVASSFNQNIGNWNVSALTDAGYMFYNAKLSIANYDALLNGWSGKTLKTGVHFDAGNSYYCAGAAARAQMTAPPASWVISDGGEVCYAPIVTTNAPTGITPTDVTFNGTVNARNSSTAVSFQYGLTTGYGSSAIAVPSRVSGTSDVSVYQLITGLTPNTTYHYRAVGVNEVGTTNGADQTFTSGCYNPYTVTNANDSGAGSLRQGFSDVCAGGTINFDGDYTIRPASTLTIGQNVTIDGEGHKVTISGDTNGDGTGDVQVFVISAGMTVTLQNLTITKGHTTYGGGLYNWGTLTISRTTFADNTANYGGGLINNGTMMVTNSTFENNHADNRGGGIHNYGTLTVLNSTFSGNNATSYGGGIMNWGGGISITNSTFSGNSAPYGGFLYINGGTVTSTNSLIVKGAVGNNCYGGIASGSNNLANDSTCGATVTNSAVINLGILGNYGGPTQTIPILAGSAAIDAGNPAVCPPTDQRGFSRAGTCDIGAFEYPKAANDFVITVNAYGMNFTIPTVPGETYNYNVDCNNDGNNDVTGATGDYTCSYPASGTYTVRIKDNTGLGNGFPRVIFNRDGNGSKLLTIEQWGTGKWRSMANAFSNCPNLAGQATDAPDLSGVTDLSQMFSFATSFNQNIGNWNTANVTNMYGMFWLATSFNQNIGNWNTANVTNMSMMFNHATSFNQNIGNWDTAKVTTMYGMFVGASAFNQPIGNWNTSNATDMSYLFADASTFNQDISNWNTAKVTDMGFMFARASAFNQNIGSWNVSSLTNAYFMFNEMKLSLANYDALLNGWSAQTVKSGVSFSGGNSTYCAGAAGRANMISIYGWTIFDGGKECSTLTVSAGTGGSITVPAASTSDYVAGTVATITAAPASGYHFTFWSGDVGTVANVNAASTTITMNGSYSITANFAPDTYTVTYDANGANSGTVPADQTKTGGVNLTLATNSGALTRTGYFFNGWNSQADGLGTHYAAGGTYTTNAAATLYAEWTTTGAVTYEANGATSGTTPADQTKMYGVDLTLATNSGALARTCYTFNSWNTQADGLGTHYAAGGTYSANAVVTLYAEWQPQPFVVTTGADSGPGSLRQAIADVCVGGVITFDTDYTITLDSELTVGKNLSIDGTGRAITISGNKNVRVINVGNVTATLKGLTIKDGYAGNGGGINNSGTLTVQNSTLTGNSTGENGYGGGINNSSTLIVQNSTLSGNSAQGIGSGGGINNDYYATLTVQNSTLSDNTAAYGGGIENIYGTVAIISSTLSGNHSSDLGGGIETLYGAVTVLNSTLSGNIAGNGGGIENYDSTVTVQNSTLSGNVGGGIHNDGTDGTGGTAMLNLTNSILAGNGQDCRNDSGTIGTNIKNLITTNAGCGTPAYTANPLLGTLGNYGGPTQTFSLLPGSPAINAGDDATCTATDQRGVARPQGSHCDIGAYELMTVTYNGNGSTSGSVPGVQTKNYDIDLTLAANSGALVRGGYTFSGWNTRADGLGTHYAAGGNYTPNASVTLYAEWGFSVTFNANGGSGTMAPQVANVATNLTANSFTRTGHSFAGWNDGLGNYYADQASYAFAADVTLYAQWTINTYTLTLTKQGAGTGNMTVSTGTLTEWSNNSAAASYTYNTSVDVTAAASSCSVFGGWGGTFTCIGSSPCSVAMTDNWTVSATFNQTPIIVNHTKNDQPYTVLQTALSDGAEGNEIRVQSSYAGAENIVHSSGYRLLFSGGYGCSFSSSGRSMSRINSLFILNGGLTLDNIQIGGQ